MNNVYVYTLISSLDHVPFYVGLGVGRRMKTHKSNAIRGRNPNNNVSLGNTIRNLVANGGDIIYERVDGLSREQAAELETYKIKQYGRLDLGTGPLCNLSDGGEGNYGEDTLRKIHVGMKRYYKTESPEHRTARLEKLRIAATNQIRPSNIGELMLAGKRAKGPIVAWNKGKRLDVEYKRKLSHAHKTSEKCKSCIEKLHSENRRTGRMRGNGNGCYKTIPKEILDEIVSLYEKGWGFRRIHSYMKKIRGQSFSKTLVISRIRESGVPMRKLLTNFNTPSSLDQSLTT